MREGTWTPTLRDDAQNSRAQLLHILRSIPGKETYLALIALSKARYGRPFKDFLAGYASERAAQDAEPKPWTPGEVAGFIDDAERHPATHRELFDLVVTRLQDLRDDLEQGDEHRGDAAEGE